MDLPKIKAVLYTVKTYKDGTHPIMIRITQNRKLAYKGVGHSVDPDAWDYDTQQVYIKKPQISKRQEQQLNPDKLAELKERYKHAIVLHNAATINNAIEDKIGEIEGVSNKLKVNEESVNIASIKSKLKPQTVGDRNKSFIAFGAEVRDAFLADAAIATYKSYKTVLAKLDTYLKSKDLLFVDITPQWLQEYKMYLLSLNNVNSTVNKNIKCIRAIYYEAIKQQLISAENNPFFIFKLKTTTSATKSRLTIDEIVALEKLILKVGSLKWHARNFFLLSFYNAGIRASDVLQLKWQNITNEGRLEYRMDKTGHHKSISLIPKAIAILNLYKTPQARPLDFIFPIIDTSLDLSNDMTLYNQISSGTALINKFLKDVAKDAEIEKTLSTHIARHSFSDIARKRKASIYDISKMLGHSSIKITEAYLASLDVDSQDEAMKSIMDY